MFRAASSGQPCVLCLPHLEHWGLDTTLNEGSDSDAEEGEGLRQESNGVFDRTVRPELPIRRRSSLAAGTPISSPFRCRRAFFLA